MTSRYPEPELPIRPVLSFASFTGERHADVPSVDDTGKSIWVTSGRIATALGLQCEGIGSGDEVLLPAYYCSSMAEAVDAVGAKPVFYKCMPDLSLDMDDVEAKTGVATKAVLAVHFFGFPQELSHVREYCSKQGLVLVEDCAHAYFGRYQGSRFGTYGDFTITSAMKFFPVSDGGSLIFPDREHIDFELNSAGPGFETKSVVNDIERSVRYGRLQPFTLLLKLPLLLKDWSWRAIKRISAFRSSDDATKPAISLGPDSSYGGYGFDAKWMHVRASLFSRFIIRRLPRKRIIEIRRRNFMRLLAALSDCEHAKPLYSSLPDDVVPYAFPLQVTNVDAVFPILKNQGVPILRWEDLNHAACEVSSRYSRQLLQLPCHQEITDKEIDWMISRIKQALQEVE